MKQYIGIGRPQDGQVRPIISKRKFTDDQMKSLWAGLGAVFGASISFLIWRYP